jgi:hypothetical protein
MAIQIDNDFSSFAGTNPVTETFIGLAKAAVLMGIFCYAMKSLESYFGQSAASINPNFETSESSTAESFRDYKEIQVETSKPSNIVEFAAENVLQAETVIEEIKEEDESRLFQQYVIGAEDDVDHINRLIGH